MKNKRIITHDNVLNEKKRVKMYKQKRPFILLIKCINADD